MGSHRTARAVIAAAVVTAITAAVVLIMGFAWRGAGAGRAQVSYNAVDMRAQMLDNGDLRITQTFDYRLESRGTPWRQMFQQYTLSSDRLTTISDISVTDLTTGRTYTQDTVHSPSGYGDAGWDSTCAGHWYIADITQSQSHPDPLILSSTRSPPRPWASRRRRRTWRSGGTSPRRARRRACGSNWR